MQAARTINERGQITAGAERVAPPSWPAMHAWTACACDSTLISVRAACKGNIPGPISRACSSPRSVESEKKCRFVSDTRFGTSRDAAVRPLCSVVA